MMVNLTCPDCHGMNFRILSEVEHQFLDNTSIHNHIGEFYVVRFVCASPGCEYAYTLGLGSD